MLDGSLPGDAPTGDGDALPADWTDATVGCSAPGNLDPSFGVGGFAPVALGLNSGAFAVVFEPSSGRLLVAGSSPADHRRCIVFALRDDGNLDTTYGTNGLTQVELTDYNCDVDDIALQSTGALVVVGEAYAEPVGGHPMLFRLAPDGSLDASFGTSGVVVAQPDVYGQVEGVVIDAQDRIVTAVQDSDDFDGTTTHFAVARYTPDGALDSTFASGGVALDAFQDGQDVAYDVALQSDGKIVVAGAAANTSKSDFGLARYEPDGSLDPTFGSGGTTIARFGGGGAGVGVALDATGRAVVVGNFSSGGAAARFTTDGVLDTQFADQGELVTHVNPYGLGFQHVIVSATGNVLVAGSWNDTPATMELLLARFDASGVPDPTFGAGGYAVASAGTNRNLGWSLVQQPDGKIVVVGTHGTWPSPPDVLVARFCP